MKFRWTIPLTLLTPIFVLVSIIIAGGGHGSLIPLIIFYPVIPAFDLFNNETLVWTVFAIQFPIYGLLIDFFRWKSRHYWAMGLIVLLHAIQIIISLTNKEFWD